MIPENFTQQLFVLLPPQILELPAISGPHPCREQQYINNGGSEA